MKATEPYLNALIYTIKKAEEGYEYVQQIKLLELKNPWTSHRFS